MIDMRSTLLILVLAVAAVVFVMARLARTIASHQRRLDELGRERRYDGDGVVSLPTLQRLRSASSAEGADASKLVH